MVEQGAGAHEVAAPVAASVRVRFVERSGKGDGRSREVMEAAAAAWSGPGRRGTELDFVFSDAGSDVL
jgi:hypothetical protein